MQYYCLLCISLLGVLSSSQSVSHKSIQSTPWYYKLRFKEMQGYESYWKEQNVLRRTKQLDLGQKTKDGKEDNNQRVMIEKRGRKPKEIELVKSIDRKKDDF